jgi:hypothetical protein
MAAQRGTMYLRYAFNIGVDINRTTGGKINDSPTPPSEDGTMDDVDDLDF